MSKRKNQEKAFLVRAREWALQKQLSGPQAFLRYVMFTFLDCLSEETDDFIFKGGNLLWIYIQTPRQTVDLDFVTRTTTTIEEVRSILDKACRRGKDKGVQFRLLSIEPMGGQQEKVGAAVRLAYETKEGASNTFDIDIVYGITTRWVWIKSPVGLVHKIRGATVEEIIVDKLSTCHRFRGGNTRMKDFDDLWRLSKAGYPIDWTSVKKLIDGRVVTQLDKGWINPEMSLAWKRYRHRYLDLPASLEVVFASANAWLKHA